MKIFHKRECMFSKINCTKIDVVSEPSFTVLSGTPTQIKIYMLANWISCGVSREETEHKMFDSQHLGAPIGGAPIPPFSWCSKQKRRFHALHIRIYAQHEWTSNANTWREACSLTQKSLQNFYRSLWTCYRRYVESLFHFLWGCLFARLPPTANSLKLRWKPTTIQTY